MTGLKNRKLAENQDCKAKIIEKNSQGFGLGRCDWLACEIPEKEVTFARFEPNLEIPTAIPKNWAFDGGRHARRSLLKSARPIPFFQDEEPRRHPSR